MGGSATRLSSLLRGKALKDKAIRYVRCDIEDLAMSTVLRGKQNRDAPILSGLLY